LKEHWFDWNVRIQWFLNILNIYSYSYIYMNTNTHSHTQTLNTQIYTHAHSHINTQKHEHTHTHKFKFTYTLPNPHTHSLTQVHKLLSLKRWNCYLVRWYFVTYGGNLNGKNIGEEFFWREREKFIENLISNSFHYYWNVIIHKQTNLTLRNFQIFSLFCVDNFEIRLLLLLLFLQIS